MTQVIDQTAPESPANTDLVPSIQEVLRASHEPLTLSKIRASLPGRFRTIALEELADTLNRQVAANVLFQYSKYRSQQDRFWDRPMPVHVAALLRSALQEGPLAWSELRRKLPKYAQGQAQSVLEEQLAQQAIHRHPRYGRGGERFGVGPADPRDYLRVELLAVFARLEPLGFNRAQLREGAMGLLQEEEWEPPTAPATPPQQSSAPAATSETSAQAPVPEPASAVAEAAGQESR